MTELRGFWTNDENLMRCAQTMMMAREVAHSWGRGRNRTKQGARVSTAWALRQQVLHSMFWSLLPAPTIGSEPYI